MEGKGATIPNDREGAMNMGSWGGVLTNTLERWGSGGWWGFCPEGTRHILLNCFRLLRQRSVPLTNRPHTSVLLESLMNAATISCEQDSFSFFISN